MLMLPKNISILCHSTVHPVHIHIKRPNDGKTHARCKSGGSGEGGVGTKHRKCFFHGNQINKCFVVHIVVIYNSGT